MMDVYIIQGWICFGSKKPWHFFYPHIFLLKLKCFQQSLTGKGIFRSHPLLSLNHQAKTLWFVEPVQQMYVSLQWEMPSNTFLMQNVVFIIIFSRISSCLLKFVSLFPNFPNLWLACIEFWSLLAIIWC